MSERRIKKPLTVCFW